MARIHKKVKKKAGLSPGTLVYTGEKKAEQIKLTVMDYDEENLQEKELLTVEECIPFKDSPTVTWINITGLHRVDVIEKIGKLFDIHPLMMEDIVHTDQRPKLEEFDDFILIILKMLSYDDEKQEVRSEQVSLLLGSNYVLSFQEAEGDVFNPVRERLRKSKGRLRKMRADYLCYALIDALVDNYFFILEKIGDQIESLEEELVSAPIPETLQKIHVLKRELLFLRKSVWPLREVIGELERGEPVLITEPTEIYFRDVYDHTIQVIDTIEIFRDMVSGMLDIYLSSVSNRMNEVMKVLTIIATIFIPLTFIAGIYGMNFSTAVSSWNMPELNWKYGYLGVLGVMLFVFLGMLVYFRRKKWL